MRTTSRKMEVSKMGVMVVLQFQDESVTMACFAKPAMTWRTLKDITYGPNKVNMVQLLNPMLPMLYSDVQLTISKDSLRHEGQRLGGPPHHMGLRP